MEQIIKKQQEEIKLLTTDINRIDKTLHYQEMISSTQVIPTKYLPKCQPETEDMSLQNRFNPQYKKLFFEHLKSVISYNTTSITIKRALLHTEIRTIENILINFTETPKQLQDQYRNFIAEVNIPQDYKPNPAIQCKLSSLYPSTSTTSTTSATRTKSKTVFHHTSTVHM